MNGIMVSLLMAAVVAQPAKTSEERSTWIYVRTVPPGASVVLDGKELGTSDGLFLVPPGVRTITLEMEGYDPEAKKVEVKEGWITRVEVRMEKKGALGDGVHQVLLPGSSVVEARYEEPHVRWALLGHTSRHLERQLLTTGELRAAFSHLEKPEVHKIHLLSRPGVTEDEFRRALAMGYEWTHCYGLWALVTPGIEKTTVTGTLLPYGVKCIQWEVAEDGTMRFGNRPATIADIREDLGGRERDMAERSVLLLECPAGSLFKDQEKLIDQALEWQREFGLAGVGLGITSTTRPGRLEDRRIVEWKVRGDGTEMELVARVEKNYGAHARQTWNPTLAEIPGILASLSDRGQRVLEIGFTEEVPEEICNELTAKAAVFAKEAGFWYACDLGGLTILPSGKRSKEANAVRWVIGSDGSRTFEGVFAKDSLMPSLLRMVPNRHRTILEVGYDAGASVKLRDEYVGRATAFAQRFDFMYASDVGVQELGSRGTAAGGVSRPLAYSAGADGLRGTEDDVGERAMPSADDIFFRRPGREASSSKASRRREASTVEGILEFHLAATEREGKSFSEGSADMGWYESVMGRTDNLVTREQGGRTQVLLWNTPEKSMVRGEGEEKEWQVIQVSVIAEPDRPGRVGVVFDKEGGQRLKELTGGNVGRQMAMVVDGRVVSCPTIRSAIGPRVEITGDFSKEELNRLATALQVGMEVSRPDP